MGSEASALAAAPRVADPRPMLHRARASLVAPLATPLAASVAAALLVLLPAPRVARGLRHRRARRSDGLRGRGHEHSAWFVGAGAAATSTRLSFDNDQELDITQYALTASGGYTSASGWSLRGSLGSVLDGTLEGDGRTYDIGPGIVVAASASKQWTFGPWFVTGSLGAGVSRTTTREAGGGSHSLVGIDVLRAGAMAGRTLGPVSPYVMARGFGGPVLWTLDGMDVTGTDTSKVPARRWRQRDDLGAVVPARRLGARRAQRLVRHVLSPLTRKLAGSARLLFTEKYILFVVGMVWRRLGGVVLGFVGVFRGGSSFGDVLVEGFGGIGRGGGLCLLVTTLARARTSFSPALLF